MHRKQVVFPEWLQYVLTCKPPSNHQSPTANSLKEKRKAEEEQRVEEQRKAEEEWNRGFWDCLREFLTPIKNYGIFNGMTKFVYDILYYALFCYIQCNDRLIFEQFGVATRCQDVPMCKAIG